MKTIKKKSLSIIIPVYNEEKTIYGVILNIKKILSQINNYDYEIIAINDGSTDNSEKEILNFGKQITNSSKEEINPSRKILNSEEKLIYSNNKLFNSSKQIKKSVNDKSNFNNLILIKNPYRIGYGASIKKGILLSNSDKIMIIDGDGTYPVDLIPKMIDYSKDYDLVIGARNSSSQNISQIRKIARKIITLLSEILVWKKIPDINSGFRIFSKEIGMKFMNIYPSGFSLTTTMTLASLTNNYSVKFLKINYLKRIGKSSMKPFNFFSFLYIILKIIAYFNPIKMFSILAFCILLIPISILIYSLLSQGKIMYDLTIITLSIYALILFMVGILADLVRGNK